MMMRTGHAFRLLSLVFPALVFLGRWWWHVHKLFHHHGHRLLLLRRRWRGLWHRPHVHSNGPVGLHHSLPDLGKDDLAVRSDKVVVTLVDVGPNDIDVEERLLDKLFHSLDKN
jgi:hypothetical protein